MKKLRMVSSPGTYLAKWKQSCYNRHSKKSPLHQKGRRLQNDPYANFFRYFLYRYIKDFLNEIIKEHPLVPYAGKDYKTDIYSEKIKENGFFAGDFELSQSIIFLI